MTIGWFVFGVVMPALVAGIGWLGLLAHERSLRNAEKRREEPSDTRPSL